MLIGGCGIGRPTKNSQDASLGWAINPKYQNSGYATEVGMALIDFGFQKLNLSLIYTTCDTRNIASFRVMEKLGMKKTDQITGKKEVKGHIPDYFRYEITNQ